VGRNTSKLDSHLKTHEDEYAAIILSKEKVHVETNQMKIDGFTLDAKFIDQQNLVMQFVVDTYQQPFSIREHPTFRALMGGVSKSFPIMSRKQIVAKMNSEAVLLGRDLKEIYLKWHTLQLLRIAGQ